MELSPQFLCIAGIVAVIATESANASQLVRTIDDFEVAPLTLDLSGVTGTLSGVGLGPPANILGGERETAFSITSNLLRTTGILKIDALNTKRFSFEQGPLVLGEGSLLYDGVGSTGLGGLDLTLGGADSFGFEFAFSDANLDIAMTVTDVNMVTATLTFTQPSAIMTPAVVKVPYDVFNNFGATDFTQANAISFNFVPQQSGSDFEIGRVGTYIIPEPSGAVLVTIGAGILFGTRRRRHLRELRDWA